MLVPDVEDLRPVVLGWEAAGPLTPAATPPSLLDPFFLSVFDRRFELGGRSFELMGGILTQTFVVVGE